MKPASRLLFVDWLRAWALLVMIETHVFNAFLLTDLRQTAWFRHLTFINGLVAPAFLFVSGFVFLVAAQKRVGELRTLGKAFRTQLRRIGVVWVIGYAMHLPSYWIPRLFAGVASQEWLRFYAVDVLHCISATWLFLLLSLAAIRSERFLRVWLTVWVIAVSGLSPWIYNQEFRPWLPTPLAGYLNDRTGSLFPLFPWSAFMLAGALCAAWFLAARNAGKERSFMLGLTGLGVAMFLAGKLLPAASTYWKADPCTFVQRLGLVLLLLGVCWLYGVFRVPRKSLLLDVSRESLFVYVAHLLLIYGPFFKGASLAYLLGKNWGPLACALASFGLAGLMVAGAKGWGAIKRQEHSMAPASLVLGKPPSAPVSSRQ